jgi:hypothetical protein
MLDRLEKEHLESLINYYKTKTIQLEYDFVSYKVKAEQQIRELNQILQNTLIKHEKEKLDILSNSNKVKKLKVVKNKLSKEKRSIK